MKRQNFFLILGFIILVVLPLWLVNPHGEEETFSGADGQAESVITQIRPDYEPWFSALWTPPSGEVESLLFAVQAALGAGAVGYALGFFRGRKGASH